MNPEELKALIKEVVKEIMNEPSSEKPKKQVVKKTTKKRGRPKGSKNKKPAAKNETPDPYDFSINKKNSERNARQVKWSGENQFEKMMDIAAAEAREEKGFDKINDKVERTPRAREPYKTVNIVCAKCKKDFNVDPIYVKERYICDDCIVRSS